MSSLALASVLASALALALVLASVAASLPVAPVLGPEPERPAPELEPAWLPAAPAWELEPGSAAAPPTELDAASEWGSVAASLTE